MLESAFQNKCDVQKQVVVEEFKPALSQQPYGDAWAQTEKPPCIPVSAEELEKVKNKIESTLVFAELSILDKAMNLAYYELLGDGNLYNVEIEKYLTVTAAEVRAQANQIFREENSSTLIYLFPSPQAKTGTYHA
ncbi:hypothetical protein FQR65_LT17849 [Abscondita terminalis]|nr:hypothetical protein FQR65_LT17849 [Abscondita terminalis]